MFEYRFKLQPYGGKGTRYTCPRCRKRHEYSRYIDTVTIGQLPPQYGKCNNIGKCGYWLDPYKDGYVKMVWEKERESMFQNQSENPKWVRRLQAPPPKQKPLVSIPIELLRQSRYGYGQNHFVQYLIRTFDADTASHLISRYHIGTSERWPGATVFWFIDAKGRIRAGQVKQFDGSGHTAKYVDKEGEMKSRTSWVHSILKHKLDRSGEPLPGWLEEYTRQGNYVSCLFGEHLLKAGPGKPVALVEAPATAIVASGYFPQFDWLATGSLSYLTAGRCQALQGRDVFLFPDLSPNGKAYGLWGARAKELAPLATFTVSDLLERNATPEEKEQGLDLRDFLTRFDYRKFREETQQAPEPEPPARQEPKPFAGTNKPVPAPEIQQPGAWDQEIEGLREYFSESVLPDHPVKLNAWTTIVDPALFVDAHLSTVIHNNGKRSFLPFLERLQELKALLCLN